VKTIAVFVRTEAAPHGTRGIGQRTRGRVHLGVIEHSRAKSLTGNWFAAVQRKIRDHLDATSTKRTGKWLDDPGDLWIDAK